MAKIKLHHPGGYSHPYWQRNKFKIELDSGEFADPWIYSKYQGDYGEEYEITVQPDGIYVQYFNCSSGGGKRAITDKKLLIKSSEYTEIEYVGTPLEMSDELKSDITGLGLGHTLEDQR